MRVPLLVLALTTASAHAGDSLVSLTLRMRSDELLRVSPSVRSPAPQPQEHSLFSLFGGSRGQYPWHVGIETTVFWCLEPASRNSPSNYRSAYDSLWFQHYRSETSFYAAIPYGDLEHGHTKANAVMCPWYRQAYQGDGVSILKDRWIAIRSGSKVAYCQIKDVGPYHTDDTGYVWQNQRPLAHDNNQAGLDISPAAQQYLGLGGLSVTDWKFVDNPPPGPWLIRDNSIAFKK